MPQKTWLLPTGWKSLSLESFAAGRTFETGQTPSACRWKLEANLACGSDPELSLLSRWAIATYQEGTWNLLTHPHYVEQAGTQNKYDGTHYVSNPQGHGRRMEQRDSRGTGGIGRGAYHRQYFINQLINSQPRNGWPSFTHGQQTWAVFARPKRTTRPIDSLRDTTSDGRLGHSPDRMG